MKNTVQSSSRLMGTLFTNCMTGKGIPFNVYNFFYLTKEGKYKDLVLEIRRLNALGEDDKVSELKHKLPSFCPTGVLPKGRTKEDPIDLSTVIWLDYDIHNRDWSEKARDKMKNVQGLLAGFLTPREGLRLLVRVPETMTVENYDLYYTVVSTVIDKMVGAEHDHQTESMVHLTSVSYDPDAWIVMPDKITDFPIEKYLAENEKEVLARLNMKKNQQEATDRKASDEESPEEELEEELNEIYEGLCRHEKSSYSKAQIDDMLTRFIGDNPLEPGLRNKNLLKLGQRAYYKRLTTDELSNLTDAVHHLIGSREYTRKRISQCLCWGYKHCNKQEICKTLYEQKKAQNPSEDDENLSHLSHLSHTGAKIDEEPIKLADAQGVFDKVVAKCCPHFSGRVYDNLPPFFKELLCFGTEERDKDKLTMGLFTCMSGMIPNVKVVVRESEYSPNLFFLGIAPAATGKSIVMKPLTLLKNLKIKFALENKKMKKEIELEDAKWEKYYKECCKKNQEINWDLKPNRKYTPKLIEESGQVSRSKLITDLANNPNGLTLFSSELDTLSESLHCDYGNHSAELRAIPSNEPVSQSYQNSEEIVEQTFPCLSLAATGTPAQFSSFIGNTHDGMISRCLVMLGENNLDWHSWGDADEDSLTEKKKIYERAAKKCTEMYEWLEKHPTRVKIPKALRYKCDMYFNYFNERIVEDKYINLKSILNRGPIHIARICSILAAIRKAEEKSTEEVIEASEQDMEVALGIVIPLLRHTCIATTILVEDGRQLGKIKNVFRLDDIFEALPDEFTTEEAVRSMIDHAGYSRATINRILTRWIKHELITKIRRGCFAKTGKKFFIENVVKNA